MNRRFADELIADLARDLGPVRPVAQLRVVGAVALSLWGAAAVLAWLLDGHAPAPGRWPWEHFVGLVGLAVAGLGGLVSSLASAIPGREVSVQRGRTAMVLGMAVALAAGAIGAWSVDGQSYAGSFGCVVRSIAMGIAPLSIVVVYLARGAAGGLRLASCLALVGSVGLGAAAVHAVCPMFDSGHVLLGHCIGPLVLAALTSFPLAYVLGRRSALASDSI